jgi:hypothetical protein
LLPAPGFATPKKKLVQSDRCICFYDSLFYLVFIVSLERFIFWELISKLVCEVCLLSGFQLQMGGESKENHLLCHFIHPPSVCENFQLQLYTAE